MCLFCLSPALLNLRVTEQSSGNLQRKAGNDRNWSRYLQQGPHVKWKLEAPFKTNTQASKCHMEDHNLTEKENSPASAIGWKNYSVSIFRLSVECFTSIICPQNDDKQRILLLSVTEVVEIQVVEIHHQKKELILRIRDFSNTIMCDHTFDYTRNSLKNKKHRYTFRRLDK